ncbi:MAG TPA: hypothetical protein VD931_11285 [Baekduia sp.]|nr:hypothetical protein [Baekduia sp.]
MRAAALLATAACCGALVAPAAAQAPPSVRLALTPDRAGAPARAVATFTPAQGEQRIPDALVVVAPAGLRFEPRAVAARCADGAAAEGSCPAASRIGAGEIRATVTLLGSQTLRGELHLGQRRAGEVAGLWLTADGLRGAVRGSVRRARGAPVVRFDGLREQAPALPPGSVRIDGVDLRLGGQKRTVTRRVRGRRVRTTYHLLRNPSRCPTGGWKGRAELVYGAEVQGVDVFTSCRPAAERRART